MQQHSTSQLKKIPWKIVTPFLVLIAIIFYIAGWFTKPQPNPETKQVVRFMHTIENASDLNIAISPDGKKIVYSQTDGSVYLRKIDQLGAIQLQNIKYGHGKPFFSPDSRELCFADWAALKKVFIEGGPAQTICDISDVTWGYAGGTWGNENTIIFAKPGSGLLRVSASGGIPEVILRPDSLKRNSYYHSPKLLPGGKAVLYTISELGPSNETNIHILSLESGKSKKLITAGTDPCYSLTGHILYIRSGSCWAVPFDAERLQITGKEVPVLEGVDYFSVSTNGTLVYTSSEVAGEANTLIHVNRKAIETPFTNKKRSYYYPRFSPDGKLVAVGINDSATGHSNIWIHNVARNTQTPLTTGGFDHTDPGWHPDSKRVFFSSNKSGVQNKYLKRMDGIGEEEPIHPSDNEQWGGSWSKDGTLFTFYEKHPKTDYDIWVYNTEDSTARPFINTPNMEVGPIFSPNGKWIAFVSNRTGQFEIYITPYPGPGQQQQISTQGGRQPWWGFDGRELFYGQANTLMVVTIETQPALKPGMPRPVFQSPHIIDSLSEPQYTIHPDGKQFLILKKQALNSSRINIVVNWFEELKEKMAAAE